MDGGCRLFKVHLQVGDFDPRDELLRPVWGTLAESGTPVVVHAGSGPVPGRFTGSEVFAEVLRSHPRLRAVIAHFGMPEEAGFLDLCQRYPGVMLDTAMVGTDFLERIYRMPRSLLPQIGELGLAGRIVFGSDFPNIPHPYSEQVAALADWGLGPDWMRAVLWDNGQQLIGGPSAAPAPSR